VYALRRVGLVVGYYLATPAFAVADLYFGVPVRVAGVLPTGPRVAYYAVVFSLGLLCLRQPRATPWVGMLESSANLLVLLLSILLPIWALPDAVMSGGPITGGLTPAGAMNALLSGAALTLSFRRHEARAAASL
jgi:hypothetical protein